MISNRLPAAPVAGPNKQNRRSRIVRALHSQGAAIRQPLSILMYLYS